MPVTIDDKFKEFDSRIEWLENQVRSLIQARGREEQPKKRWWEKW